MMKNKYELDARLQSAYDDCMEEERSIEYTLQYLQDMCNVSFDVALNFIKKQGIKNGL